MRYWKTLKTVLLEGREFSEAQITFLRMMFHGLGISRYGLPKNVMLDLCVDLAPNLEGKTCCNHLSVQVLSTLGFLATGTFLRELSDRSGISRPHHASSDRGDSTCFPQDTLVFHLQPTNRRVKAEFVRQVTSILS